MKNVLMIDIETTGTRPGCRVLTIGAFGFSRDGEQVKFYKRLNATDQRMKGLTDDVKTIEWWSSQSPEAFKEAWAGECDVAEAIAEFKAFFYKNFSTAKGANFQAWACGIDFDFPILERLMQTYGFQLPWMFFMQYDYRTVKNLFPKIKEHEGNVLKHSAIEDAAAQLRGLRYFFAMREEAMKKIANE